MNKNSEILIPQADSKNNKNKLTATVLILVLNISALILHDKIRSRHTLNFPGVIIFNGLQENTDRSVLISVEDPIVLHNKMKRGYDIKYSAFKNVGPAPKFGHFWRF